MFNYNFYYFVYLLKILSIKIMIDELYKSVQAILNKDQLGYLKPLDFNLFVNIGIRKITNKLLVDLKSSVRKSNWWLEGKNLSNLSEHTRQLLEFYSDEEYLDTPFLIPENFEYIEDVFKGDIRIDKVHYSDFKDLSRNIYSKPTDCAPICSKVGNKIKVSPSSIKTIQVHFLRKPKKAKWTFFEYLGKPMFDATASDFQDIDLPNSLYDDLVSIVIELASKSLRELNIAQLENTEQQLEAKSDNKQ